MADAVTTDLFKFVAIRPAQRVGPRETATSIARDPRASTADGARMLAQRGRELATTGQALQRWQQLDLAALAPLAEAHTSLLTLYDAIEPDAPAPNGLDLLERAGARRTIAQDAALRDAAWDALYVADATGADAGPRLEIPMAVVRLLHFAALLADEPTPSREDALTALRAVPAIPPALRAPAPAPAPPPAPPPSHETDAGRRASIRALATELYETERLVEAVTRPLARPAAQATIQRGPAVLSSGLARTTITVSTAPSLREVLAPRLAGGQAALLDRIGVSPAATLPAATQTLQAHYQALSARALPLADDPEFYGAMRELRGSLVGPALSLDVAKKYAEVKALEDPGSAPEVDVAGKIIPLGVGDLKVVKQTLLEYLPGEVAHIENVLKGESKSRKHRKLDRVESTVVESEEETRETERDTQSTDRMELKRETAQTIKEDLSVSAGLTVTASFGPVVTTATGDFAYSTSKEDSVKSSSNYARDVVDRSVSKVQTKVSTQRTTKTISESEETNEHGVDNVGGPGHVIGVYRWVDKKYRAQVHNYGVRLLLEFIVPEPAAFWRASKIGQAARNVNAVPPAPFVNKSGDPLAVTDITPGTYLGFGSRWGVSGLTPPPPEWVFIGTSMAKEGIELGKTLGMTTKEFVVPEGYLLQYYVATISLCWFNWAKFNVLVGRDHYNIINRYHSQTTHTTNEVRGDYGAVDVFSQGPIPVSVTGYDIQSFAVNVQGVCSRTPEAYAKWQSQTYDKLRTAWQALQKEFDQKLDAAEAAAGFAITGQNPGINRIVERNELKKLCITMMTGQHYKQFDAMTDPSDKPAHYPEVMIDDALGEGRIAQFFEQAFEWEQMTYLFYAYFWGRKRNWVEISRLSDPDPLFHRFLTAGYARVVVPVPMAYADAVQYLLQSKAPALKDRVWRGGPRPTIDDPLYISITDEMRRETDDLAGAVPEGDPWEYTLPTTLVWLQPDGTLPKFV